MFRPFEGCTLEPLPLWCGCSCTAFLPLLLCAMHIKVERAADRITRINSAVHYKAPASELPALPPPSRLVAAIPPVFPPRAPDALGLAEAIEGPSGSGDGVPDPALAQVRATAGA